MRHLAFAGALALACLAAIPAQARAHRHGPVDIRPARAAMADIVLAAARRHHVPAGFAYGVAAVESGFNPHARSRAGALGLMQLLPSTARGLGCRGNLYDPRVNAECGMTYLAQILRDQRGDLRQTAARYTQGRYARRVSPAGARYATLVLAASRRRAAV